MNEAGIIVTFVQVFEYRGEDLGFLIGKKDSLNLALRELSVEDILEEWRGRQHVFMGGKDARFLADYESDDG